MHEILKNQSCLNNKVLIYAGACLVKEWLIGKDTKNEIVLVRKNNRNYNGKEDSWGS